jgi:hypothetical protein
VTGDVNEMDDICAMTGIRTAGFRTDEDFNEQEVRALNIKKAQPLRDPRNG